MGFQYTDKQQKVLDARSHNIIVSAAAGSGKTAVLVERIIRMITEPNPVTGAEPLDIDRLLVVTFTRAAAAQMRERIAQAIAARLATNPGDRHLQRQETLLHHAQITTIDSFCTFLLRNNFSDIDLDPAFRQMDETESRLLRGDVWEAYIAAKYDQADPAFLTLTDTWCRSSDDKVIEETVMKLVTASESHPDPVRWLRARRADYDVTTIEEVLLTPWMQDLMLQALRQFEGIDQMLQAGISLAYRPAGPVPYGETMEQERAELFGAFGTLDPMAGIAHDGETLQRMLQGAPADPQTLQDIYNRIIATLHYAFPRLKQVRDKSVDPDLKDRVKDIHDAVKDRHKKWVSYLCAQEPGVQIALMQQAAESLHVLVDLAIEFTEEFRKVKARNSVIDFGDLERLALGILLETEEDETMPEGVRYVPRRTALAYRSYFAEVLIDEYQDSNEVQELLLSAIAGEDEGRYARFMVGDVKQSIYRFRNARPEIFVDKLDHYRFDDAEMERIDLDQNFRSRSEVLDATNDVFMAIMRREIGGVTYDDLVSLKPGATYEDPDATWADARRMFGADPYRAQLLIVHNDKEDAAEESADGASGADSADGTGDTDSADTNANADTDLDELTAMPFRKKEALAIAMEIKRMVGAFPVTDEVTHELRPARYRDIVVLMRSGGAWNDAIREIFDREGIPLYVDYKAGYFSAEEIRQVLQALKVIDNPDQDIPLYGMMHGYFGGFSEDALGQIRAANREGSLLTAVRSYDQNPELQERCRAFLARLDAWREASRVTPIHEFVTQLITTTGYEDYVTALPAGAQRRANLQSLVVKAAAFEQTQYAGLFEFLRYLDSMHQYEVDYGEANVLDESADVVRLMTIHKSKGLEFPIVFASGLAGQFAYKGKDVSGQLIIDADLGLGIDYIDPDLRARVGTLRKVAVADRIRRASLGEELRVLYVAMTRAKERLILTGFVKDLDQYLGKIGASRAGILPTEDAHLPMGVIQSAGSYLDLVMLARNDRMHLDVQTVAVSNMRLSEVEAQMSLGLRKSTLEQTAALPAQDLPVPALAAELEGRLSFRYPHADLDGLYTKCSVSDVKRARADDGIIKDLDESYDGGLDTSEAAVPIYEIPPEAAEDIPRFVRDAQDPAETAAQPATLGPAARGTAVHRVLELVDYHRWSTPQEVTAEMFDAWAGEILAAGLVPRSYESVMNARTFLPFLRSDVAARIAAADARGDLRREQPFVIGVPADTINPAFPRDETILVQGIIDAFWIEEIDGARRIVILDYKTDHVQDPQILVDRYRVQLDYYAQALTRILHLPVGEELLYSVHMQRTIRVPADDV